MCVLTEKIILAHMGGDMPKEVLEHLAGENVYFDMGYVLNYYLDDGSLRKNDKRYKNYQ